MVKKLSRFENFDDLEFPKV